MHVLLCDHTSGSAAFMAEYTPMVELLRYSTVPSGGSISLYLIRMSIMTHTAVKLLQVAVVQVVGAVFSHLPG